ncbi:MAG TPA: hypothetical protein VEA61_02660 [Allosphingosinicella sp.]|nr:hypothetical protein [Allosphingosinicella sp.]
MPNPRLAVALPVLLLAACGRGEPTAADNNVVHAGTKALEDAVASEPGQANGSIEPGADPVPPPDAVSHPDGYLPDAAEPPAPSAPATDNSSASREPPPATEDEHMRNRQTNG